MDIVVTDEFFEHREGAKLFGTIYLEMGGVFFPCAGWTDFVEDVLSAWAHELLCHESGEASRFTLYFMDGPYELDIAKDSNGDMTARCVGRGRVEGQIDCGYDDFLNAVGRALKTLNRVLLARQGWKPDGLFTPVIAHNVMLAEKLAAMGSGK